MKTSKYSAACKGEAWWALQLEQGRQTPVRWGPSWSCLWRVWPARASSAHSSLPAWIWSHLLSRPSLDFSWPLWLLLSKSYRGYHVINAEVSSTKVMPIATQTSDFLLNGSIFRLALLFRFRLPSFGGLLERQQDRTFMTDWGVGEDLTLRPKGRSSVAIQAWLKVYQRESHKALGPRESFFLTSHQSNGCLHVRWRKMDWRVYCSFLYMGNMILPPKDGDFLTCEWAHLWATDHVPETIHGRMAQIKMVTCLILLTAFTWKSWHHFQV